MQGLVLGLLDPGGGLAVGIYMYTCCCIVSSQVPGSVEVSDSSQYPVVAKAYLNVVQHSQEPRCEHSVFLVVQTLTGAQ
jgi:hypothetical protein